MMKKTFLYYLFAAAMLLIASASFAQSTSFTFQGQLKDGSEPANGEYDLSFSLYDAPSGGTLIGGTGNIEYRDDKTVTEGVFSVELEFGGQTFVYSGGADCWIEVAVRPGSISNSDRTGYTTLSPRQKVTPTPFALYSQNAGLFDGRSPNTFANQTHQHGSDSITSLNADVIDSGALAEPRIDEAIARDSEVITMLGLHAGIEDIHHIWPLTDTEIPNTLTISSSSSVSANAIKIGTVAEARIASSIARDSEVFSLVLASDGPGTNLNADLLDGQDSSAFISAGTDNWVNTSGDSMTGILEITDSTSGGVLRVENTGGYTNCSAVRGINSYSDLGIQYGGDFEATSSHGRGVHGVASKGGVSITNYGGYFEAAGGKGRAVYGVASATTTTEVPSYGGYFESLSMGGRGLRGVAAATYSTNNGIIGETKSPDGYAGYFTGPVGSKNYFQRDVAIGTTDPLSPLYVQSQNNWGPDASGNGWGDFCVGVDNSGTSDDWGLCIGVATDGGGAGIARIWNHDHEGSIIFGNRSGDILYLDGINMDQVGIKRQPTTNSFELNGSASKSTAGSWLANSDERIKTDIQPITNALETLEKVRLVDFRYNAEYLEANPEIDDHRYVNVIAQEFIEVFPDYVQTSGDKFSGGDGILQVDTYPLIIYSAAAAQELSTKVKEQAQEINQLQEQNARLEERLARLEGLLLSSAKGGTAQ